MHMPEARMEARTKWLTILGDVHFWIPLVVLVGGLALLHWIS